jgi:hypothetical protein
MDVNALASGNEDFHGTSWFDTLLQLGNNVTYREQGKDT